MSSRCSSQSSMNNSHYRVMPSRFSYSFSNRFSCFLSILSSSSDYEDFPVRATTLRFIYIFYKIFILFPLSIAQRCQPFLNTHLVTSHNFHASHLPIVTPQVLTFSVTLAFEHTFRSSRANSDTSPSICRTTVFGNFEQL